jgi:hypothetical protein
VGVLLTNILDPTLADNGGPTLTHTLVLGSPAIDAIPATDQGCTGVNQRGVPRPQGTGCDIGAVEVEVTAVTFAVTNTTDSGPGSLRQAILDANASGEPLCAIILNIPTTDAGFDGQVFTIRPSSALPAFERPTVLNGASQTVFSGDSNPFGPEVVLNGSLAGSSSGLVIHGNESVISGLVVNGFPGGAGIAVGFNAEATPSDNRIRDNYLGTDPTGTVAVPNGIGVALQGSGSPDTQAMANAVEGNVIAGNTGAGLSLGFVA